MKNRGYLKAFSVSVSSKLTKMKYAIVACTRNGKPVRNLYSKLLQRLYNRRSCENLLSVNHDSMINLSYCDKVK